jgi:GTP-binding protein EngB required for normal cell division
MSSDGESRIQKLVGWYRSHVKPFLTKTDSEKGEEFDRDAERLQARDKRVNEELAICFLGNSGVGKSTLINALVAGREVLLPAGGVGPLTAQALTVRYSDNPRFEVNYHSPQKLRQLVFALEQIHKKDSSLPATDDIEDPGSGLDPAMMEEIRLELEAPDGNSDTSQAEQNEPREQYKKQAQLMVKGNQDRVVDLPYLIDSLHYVGGWKPLWGMSPLKEDMPNLERLRTALELGKKNTAYKLESSINRKLFQDELRAHASGYLAPLIRDLQVFWDSPLLQEGLTIVDLPGIGIAGDVNRDITNEWIREKARAIVLVVDSGGITQSSADLLYKTGFLNSLLYTSDDPANDPVLVVAVVKVDDIANSRFDEDKAKRRALHFQEVCVETIQNVKSQLRAQLENNWSQQGSEGSDGPKGKSAQ